MLVATFGPSNHFFGQKKMPRVKDLHFWVRGNMPLDDTPKTCFLYRGLPCSTFQLAMACPGMKHIAWYCNVLRHGVGRHLLDKGMWQHPISEFCCGSQSAKFMYSLYACGMPRMPREKEHRSNLCECASVQVDTASMML